MRRRWGWLGWIPVLWLACGGDSPGDAPGEDVPQDALTDGAGEAGADTPLDVPADTGDAPPDTPDDTSDDTLGDGSADGPDTRPDLLDNDLPPDTDGFRQVGAVVAGGDRAEGDRFTVRSLLGCGATCSGPVSGTRFTLQPALGGAL